MGDPHELRAELARKIRELERSNKDLEHFAYVASHDLQTPLRQIEGFTKLLDEEYGDSFDDTAKQYMQFVVQGAERCRILIDDLLAFSRVGRKMKVCTFPLDHCLDDALLILGEDLVEKQVEILREPLPTITGDKTLFTRVFQNLVGNAVKFRHPDRDPVVSVCSTDEGDAWKISVADNGIGIDMRYAERIFMIFQRLSSTKNGTGVGLALCARVVERHRGRIWLESVLGEGSTFHFTIPKEYVNGTDQHHAG